MRTHTKELTIDLTGEEARSIAYHISHALQASIDEHYVSIHHDSYRRGYEGHAKPLLYEQQGESIRIMNQLFSVSTGDSDNYLEKDLLRYFEKKYTKKNGSLTLEEKESK